jgi:hypothetical protein
MLIDELSGIISSLFDNTLIPGLVITQDVEFFLLLRQGPGGYDATTGSSGDSYDDAVSTKAVVSDYTAREIGASKGGGSGLLQVGDVKIIVQVSEAIPAIQPGDSFGWRSRRYRVISIERRQLNGADALFVCQVRK